MIDASDEQFARDLQADRDFGERLEAERRLEAYDRAIERAEKAFRKNKSRMWVLKILKDYIKEELGEAPAEE